MTKYWPIFYTAAHILQPLYKFATSVCASAHHLCSAPTYFWSLELTMCSTRCCDTSAEAGSNQPTKEFLNCLAFQEAPQRVVIDSKVTNFLHSWVVIGAFNDLSSNFCTSRFSKTRLKFNATESYVTFPKSSLLLHFQSSSFSFVDLFDAVWLGPPLKLIWV